MIRPQRIITLENKITEVLDEYHGYSQAVVVRKIGIVVDEFVKEVGRAAWIDGWEYKNMNKVRYLEFLESCGFIFPRTYESLPKFNYEKIGLPLDSAITIDSKKLLQQYPSPYNTKFEPTHWFNNSIIEFEKRYFMSYRMDLYPFSKYTRLAICELDENFIPIEGSNKLLDLPSKMNGFGAEDGRLFIYANRLYITYCTNYGGNNFQIAIAEIDTKNFSIVWYQFLDKPFPELPEKNWLFFTWCEQLCCIYHADCMNVFMMNKDDSGFDAGKESQFVSRPVNWNWGEVRGGASPIQHPDNLNWYHFFHSTKYILHKQSGRRARQFFVGCQVFQNEPPFSTIAISKEPLLTRSEIDAELDCPSLPQAIVYPCGVIFKDGNWIISFGDSDSVCKLISISDDTLNENLISL